MVSHTSQTSEFIVLIWIIWHIVMLCYSDIRNALSPGLTATSTSATRMSATVKLTTTDADITDFFQDDTDEPTAR